MIAKKVLATYEADCSNAFAMVWPPKYYLYMRIDETYHDWCRQTPRELTRNWLITNHTGTLRARTKEHSHYPWGKWRILRSLQIPMRSPDYQTKNYDKIYCEKYIQKLWQSYP
jgi:hypothetical protein